MPPAAAAAAAQTAYRTHLLICLQPTHAQRTPAPCTPPSHVHAAPHAPAHRSPRAPLEARLASHRPLLKQEQGLPERAVLHIRTCHGRAQSPLPAHISGRATLRAAAFVVASAPVGRRCARCPALGVHRPTSGGCGVRCSVFGVGRSALGTRRSTLSARGLLGAAIGPLDGVPGPRSGDD